MTHELTQKAIAANIEALRAQLSDCSHLCSESFRANQQGEQNAARVTHRAPHAIGWILDFDPQCAASNPSSRASALALYRAAVALHRGERSRPETSQERAP